MQKLVVRSLGGPRRCSSRARPSAQPLFGWTPIDCTDGNPLHLFGCTYSYSARNGYSVDGIKRQTSRGAANNPAPGPVRSPNRTVSAVPCPRQCAKKNGVVATRMDRAKAVGPSASYPRGASANLGAPRFSQSRQAQATNGRVHTPRLLVAATPVKGSTRARGGAGELSLRGME